MKNQKKKILLGATSLLGMTVGLTAKKSKALRFSGLAIGAVSSALLISKIWKDEKKKVEESSKKTEDAIEKSGLNPDKVLETGLIESTEKGRPVIFGETLLETSYTNSVFEDQVLEYNPKTWQKTLHVLQVGEKIRISIPLPLIGKRGSLEPKIIRDHFQVIFDEFIKSRSLDMKAYINQVGVQVWRGAGEGGEGEYTYFSEIERNPGETFRDYLGRIKDIFEDWEDGYIEDDETIRYEQYLNLDFPVFPKKMNRRGLDIVSTMELLKKLMEPHLIKINGKEFGFQFSNLNFHPGDDLGQVIVIDYQKKEMVIKDL